MINLNPKQLYTKQQIELFAPILGIDTKWAISIAMTESGLGTNQLSPTGCKGVFQMSSIAMKDLLLSMETKDDDLVDILCGLLFLRLLFKRYGSIDEATNHFCDPADKDFYLQRVHKFIKEFE